MSVGTTIDIIWMMMGAEMYGMTPMAKIDRRDSAPPENMLTIPRMVVGAIAERSAPLPPDSRPHRNEGADAVHDPAPMRKRNGCESSRNGQLR